ncbi:MAG: glycosyltransferase family 1 protein [Microbacteriaceae bacterium]
MSVFSRFADSLRDEGVKSAVWRTTKAFATRLSPFRIPPLAEVFPRDIIDVDWTLPNEINRSRFPRKHSGYHIAWLISPPSPTSGGHQNAFRFLKELEGAGNRITVYLYHPLRYPRISIEAIREMMAETTAYPDLDAEFRMYDPEVGIEGDPDALMACDWSTAYAVRRHTGRAKQFYFTQDFEPAFYPWGSDYVAAENTYRFGLHGFSAGRWLAAKLRDEYNMSCDSYDYAIDPSLYERTNLNRRTGVLFYARPTTPRRATEFGLLALAELHRLRPDIDIHLVGWDMSGFDVPFPYINHTALDIAQLNGVYNQCAAALLLSLTNLSLLPIEVMAAGTVPVVNDAPNTRGVLDNPFVEFTPMAPRALADRLIAAVERDDQVEHSERIAASVRETDWSDPGAEFVAQFNRAMQHPVQSPSEVRK